jgi:hypothetical protein
MSVIYAATLRTARLNAVLTAIDADVGAAKLEICSAAYAAVLATITLNDPAGSVSGDVLTFIVSPQPQDASADNTGVAAIARIKDNSGDIIVSGLTVGTSGADIIVTSTNITAGDTVKMTAGTITHPST